MSFANVARFLPEQARARPAACAVRAPMGDDPAAPGRIAYASRTFAELDAEADAAARLFKARGIGRGTRVLLLVTPGLDLLRCVFALFKIGAVPVLIDPGMGLKNFLECVRRSEPAALVGIAKAHWLALIFRGALASAKIRVKVGGAAWERDLAAQRASEPLAPAETRAEELAAILFTSGSTGAPKGVCYEHGFFEAQVRLIRERYGIEPGEIDLPMLPVFALFNPAMGMTTVVPEMNPSRPAACNPARLVQAITQNHVTNSFGSPALWALVARHCEATGQTLPSLRRVLAAGAPVHPTLLRRLEKILPNGTVHIPYGATEALPVSSISLQEVLGETWTMTEQGRGSCVGSPFPGVEVRILPLRDGPMASLAEAPELPVGQIGEIVVRGPSVTRAYDKLPLATARAKIPAGDPNDPGAVWHRMGDVGYRDERGRLWFCGRAAERVETAAGVFYTDCAEGVFNRHPRVARTALIGLGERPRQEAALVVEPAPGQFPQSRAGREAFAAELRALAVAGLPELAKIFFRRTLPVDVRHNAKIHRLALAREYSK
ncbi:MAG TPA: fatty acid CoA ligase family protein [Opitutales bacterium]|nr:fatty acid CoA ligase family protein [Opitutales bacterium]